MDYVRNEDLHDTIFEVLKNMTVKDTLFFRFAICCINQTLQLYNTFELVEIVEGVMMKRKLPVFKHFLID
jgi:hypothetical protein